MAANPPFADGEKPSAAKWNSLVGVYERSTSAVDVVSSAAETDLYSKSILAGHLSSDRMLRLTLLGDYLNNSGSTQTITLRFKYGATTMFGDVASVATGANRYPLLIVAHIAVLGATNSQWLAGSIALGSPLAGSVAGRGDIDGGMDPNANWSGSSLFAFDGSAAEDSTAAKTLAVTAQHGASNANLSIRKHYAALELL